MSSWRLLSQVNYANTEEEFEPDIEYKNDFYFATADSDNVVVVASQAGHRLRFGTCSSYILLLTCSVLGLKSFFFALRERAQSSKSVVA